MENDLKQEFAMADEELLIDDQYQLAVCIASGSSSQVWEVIEKSSARHLAMKLLKTDVPDFKENKAQMKRESEIHKTLDHPMIVKFERYSSNRDHTYILMEYFRASNLKLQIKADTNGVHLKVRQLFEGVCAALSYVHQKGFIHRDIKPDNVLMNKVGEIRLCDFSLSSKQATGLAKVFAGKLKNIQGTRTYIAPETIRKQQPSFQTDMYSLGVMFFEVLTCKTPFQAPTPEELLQKHLRAEPPNPSEFNPNVSPEMDRIIAKLLKKKPSDRPASVEEVLSELKRVRIFKEDIVDAVAAKKANEDKDALEMLSEIRLDSRADAKLKSMLETNPEFAKKFAAEKANKATIKKAANDKQSERIKNAESVEAARTKSGKTAKPAASTTPPQPQPVAFQQPMPMPMQGYPQGYPQALPQGYPQGYPQGFPQVPPSFPGYQQPQMPLMPGMPLPGMPMPGPVAPQSPPTPQVPTAQPGTPAQATQSKSTQTPPKSPTTVTRPSPPNPVNTKASPPSPPQTHAENRSKSAAPITPPPAVKKTAPPVAPPTSGQPELDFMTDLPDVL